MWPIWPYIGTSDRGRVVMYADTYAFFEFPGRRLVDGVAIREVTGYDVPSAAILRNYTRDGEKARHAPVGFAPNRRRPIPPRGHFRHRDDSLRSTDVGTGECFGIRTVSGEKIPAAPIRISRRI